MRLQRSLAAATSAVLLALGATACTSQPIDVIPPVTAAVNNTTLVIGVAESPDDASPQQSQIISAVYAQALAAAGIKTTFITADASDPTLLGKLKTGQVDIVPGYSASFLETVKGTGGAAVNDPGKVVDELKSTLAAPVKMLDAAAAADKGTLVVTTAIAQRHGLKTIEDLAKVCNKLDFAAPVDFAVKGGQLEQLSTTYGCKFKTFKGQSNTDRAVEMALIRDEVQVADIHSASPAIARNALVVLEDPKQMFVANRMVPVVNQNKVPDSVQSVINKVTAALNDEQLINLNRLIEGNNFPDAKSAADAWLRQVGLLKAAG